MLDRTIENPGEDFHVAMRMHSETLTGRDDVFIQNAQRAELHMLRVVILIERKCEMRVEPRKLVAPALFTGSNLNHVGSPSCLVPCSVLYRRSGPASGRSGVTFPVHRLRGGSFPGPLRPHVRGKPAQSAARLSASGKSSPSGDHPSAARAEPS